MSESKSESRSDALAKLTCHARATAYPVPFSVTGKSMSEDNVEIRKADFSSSSDAEAIMYLLNSYACDPMGGSEELSDFCKQNLVSSLSKIPSAHVFLCFVDKSPAGIAICFETFSTFACAPLLNIHDFAVHPSFRRRGLSQRLLDAVEALAREKKCCKLTLEVLEGNAAAQAAYIRHGFAGYELDPSKGRALFWQKKLTT
jgi:GNAT superfamily N-acetyltransferase